MDSLGVEYTNIHQQSINGVMYRHRLLKLCDIEYSSVRESVYTHFEMDAVIIINGLSVTLLLFY